MEAAARDVAQGVAEVFGGGCAPGAEAGDAGGDAACRREEEVARAAGRIEDAESQERLSGE